MDPSHHPLSRFILFLRGKHKNSSQDFLQHCNVPENYYFTRARKKDPFMICPAAVKSRRRFFNRSQPFPFFSVLAYATLLEIFSLAMEETPKLSSGFFKKSSHFWSSFPRIYPRGGEKNAYHVQSSFFPLSAD